MSRREDRFWTPRLLVRTLYAYPYIQERLVSPVLILGPMESGGTTPTDYEPGSMCEKLVTCLADVDISIARATSPKQGRAIRFHFIDPAEHSYAASGHEMGMTLSGVRNLIANGVGHMASRLCGYDGAEEEARSLVAQVAKEVRKIEKLSKYTLAPNPADENNPIRVLHFLHTGMTRSFLREDDYHQAIRERSSIDE